MILGVCQGPSSISIFSMLTSASHRPSAIAELLLYKGRLYKVLPKGWQITPKRGVVMFMWPIFLCATVDLWTTVEKILHGTLLTAINNAVEDGLLLIAPTALETTLRLRLSSIGSICHCICCKVRCITYTGCANKKQSPRKNSVFQPWEYCFEPNFQTLYVSIQATYRANFIEITYMVQQIQQFKF